MPGAKLCDYLAVDLDTPCEDQFLRFATAGDTRRREDLLQALAFRLLGRAGRSILNPMLLLHKCLKSTKNESPSGVAQ